MLYTPTRATACWLIFFFRLAEWLMLFQEFFFFVIYERAFVIRTWKVCATALLACLLARETIRTFSNLSLKLATLTWKGKKLFLRLRIEKRCFFGLCVSIWVIRKLWVKKCYHLRGCKKRFAPIIFLSLVVAKWHIYLYTRCETLPTNENIVWREREKENVNVLHMRERDSIARMHKSQAILKGLYYPPSVIPACYVFRFIFDDHIFPNRELHFRCSSFQSSKC